MTHRTGQYSRPLQHTPPVWKLWRGILYAEAGRLLSGVARLARSQHARRIVAYVAVVLGLLAQLALLALASYLIDLSISLMELWAELARKHLELTLS